MRILSQQDMTADTQDLALFVKYLESMQISIHIKDDKFETRITCSEWNGTYKVIGTGDADWMYAETSIIFVKCDDGRSLPFYTSTDIASAHEGAVNTVSVAIAHHEQKEPDAFWREPLHDEWLVIETPVQLVIEEGQPT